MVRKNRGWLLIMPAFVLWFAASCFAQTNSATAAPAKPSAATQASSAATQPLLDINTANPDQLKALPGIGDAYAKRIIDGRPYAAKNQLVQRGILPQNTYDKIKDRIIAHRVSK